MSDIIRYLERVVAQSNGAWFNIHRRVIDPAKTPPERYPGSAHQSFRTAWLDIQYWMRHGYDVYLAQGAYLNPGEHYRNKPYPSALRQKANLIACKTLYMDVDVKEKAFPDTSTAKKAVLKFVTDAGLPLPTIIVASGSGGLHVYWTLDQLITPAEHEKLAGKLVTVAMQHGIFFDQQCTTDQVRLLRVADTWNFKAAPKPVSLIWDSKIDVSVDAISRALDPYAIWVTPVGNHKARTREPNANEDMMMPKEHQSVDIDAAAKDCPFLRDTLLDGGKTLPEPLWKHTISLACHTTDPDGNAHRLSRGHDDYTPEETDAKLARAQQDRLSRSIGPPLCNTIFLAGASQCPNCPHRALGTTPLHVQFKKVNGSAPQFMKGVTPGNDIDLPPGYYRGTDQLVHLMHVAEDDDDDLAFEYQIIPGSGYVEKSAPCRLVFETIQAGQQVPMTFETGLISDQFTLARALADKAMPVTKSKSKATTLMVNYLKQLQESNRTFITAPAFGWSLDGDGNWGFAFSGEYTSSAGTFKCTRPGVGGELYGVTGDEKPWRDLADIVLTPDRPDLCMLAATTFGAPLIHMSGQDGLILGVTSKRSGIGKTTALKLNEAVWGMPVLGGLNDTVNYTFGKCALVRHLPVNHDEIKGTKQIEAMCDLVFQLTSGSEKGRSGRDGQPKIKRQFQTNVNYASNGSIINPVRDAQLGTDASWLRMLEMRGIEDGYNLTHDVAGVGRATQDLRLNYGHVGRKYAAFIGKNHLWLLKEYVKLHDSICLKLQPTQEERFWMSAISTTLMGAKLANHLGIANFPLAEMFEFAAKEYRFLKQDMHSNSSDYGRDAALASAIGAFLNENRERGLVILDKTWTTAGRPPKSYAKVVNDHQGKQWGRLNASLSGEPVTLRVSDAAIGEWCGRTKRPKSALLHALQDKLGARLSGATLGSGSNKAGSRENCWVLMPMGTILEPAVDEYIEQYGLKP